MPSSWTVLVTIPGSGSRPEAQCPNRKPGGGRKAGGCGGLAEPSSGCGEHSRKRPDLGRRGHAPCRLTEEGSPCPVLALTLGTTENSTVLCLDP